MKVNQQQLDEELAELASIQQGELPAVTRIVYSEADRRARRWLRAKCEAAGLGVREDALGNLFARWPGAEPDLPAIGTGSHIDAIPNAGMYDGTVGVLGGLEAIRTLQRAGFKPRRSIELLAFISEEPTRFGIGCLGSRMLSGVLDAEAARALLGKDGLSLDEARAAAGFSGPLQSVRLPAGYYARFIELHIEQGPLLEESGIPLGVVTAIAAPASLRATLHGEGGHAGGKLMPGRKDALAAAAELILAVEQAALTSGAVDSVATVGVCEVFPGAVNSIPSRVKIEMDLRDTDLARRDRMLTKVRGEAAEIEVRRGIRTELETINADDPASCDETILRCCEQAAAVHGWKSQRMVSRAYHDSTFMAKIAPIGMLFIPCHGGVSHRPDEFASSNDIARGVQVLAETMAALSQL